LRRIAAQLRSGGAPRWRPIPVLGRLMFPTLLVSAVLAAISVYLYEGFTLNFAFIAGILVVTAIVRRRPPERVATVPGTNDVSQSPPDSAAMSRKTCWAYAFTCEQPMEAILAALNAAGPWQWQARDSAWYGDYLNVRPVPGARVRIHEFPSSGSEEAGVYVGPGTVDGVVYDQGFTALLEAEAPANRLEIDRTFRGLLEPIGATNVREIAAYD
jgi:hypothetical protein